MPIVSVIVPTCDRPVLLRRALESILSQDAFIDEIIIVDDGEKTDAKAIAESFGGNVIYLKNEVKLGGAASRNRGIKVAQGDYIAFLDDDDIWLPGKLRQQIEAFSAASPRVGFVYTAVRNRFDDYEDVTYVPAGETDLSIISLTRFKGFLTSTLLVRRQALTEVGNFDGSLPSHQEAELILRLAQKFLGYGLNEPLVEMDVTTSHEHIGSKIERRIAGRELVLKKHEALLSRYPNILARHYFWLGLLYRDAGRLEEAVSVFRLALAKSFNLLTFFHYVKSVVNSRIRGLKKRVVRILNHQHVGTLIRGMYFRRYISKVVSRGKIKKALDAGCGRGQYAAYLARLCPEVQVTGLDIFDAPEWELYHEPNLRFGVMDLEQAVPEESYDLVVTIDTLEHIRDNNRVLSFFYDTLNPGGYLYLAVPCDAQTIQFFPERFFKKFRDWEIDEHIGYQWTISELVHELKTRGFKIELARYTFTSWGIIAWEIEFILRESAWGGRFNLILMPLYRLLGLLDIYLPLGRGNNLVIAKK